MSTTDKRFRSKRGNHAIAMVLTTAVVGCGLPRLERHVLRAATPDRVLDRSLTRTKATAPSPAFPTPILAGISPAPAPLAGATPPTIPITVPPFPIDLSTALRLADAENPTIGVARVGILDALAQQQAAQALLLPTLNAGTNYHGHDGNLQRSSGRILRVSEQSLYVGGGARSLAAESVAIPAVTIFSTLTEAIFEPLAARQRVVGARLNAVATGNTVLLEVTDLFFELIGAEATLASQRRTAGEADEIAKIVRDYATTGQGRKADADRSDAERRLLQGKIQNAEEEVAVASARLSRRLNLDATVRLQGFAGPLEPLDLIDASPPPEVLVRTALGRRPDLGSRAALVSLAEYKLKEEQARPLLPTLFLGFSGAAFGGGSNITPPELGRFGGRTDFDVRATWTLLNFGVGNASLAKRRRAEMDQAIAERSRVINRIRSEVIGARAQALSQRQQVEITRVELASAEQGYREDMIRQRETVGLPIEVIDSLRLLGQSRLNLIRAITRSNQAQFALFVALGSPPPLDSSTPVSGLVPPVATPLRSPIVMPRAETIPCVKPPGPPVLGK